MKVFQWLYASEGNRATGRSYVQALGYLQRLVLWTPVGQDIMVYDHSDHGRHQSTISERVADLVIELGAQINLPVDRTSQIMGVRVRVVSGTSILPAHVGAVTEFGDFYGDLVPTLPADEAAPKTIWDHLEDG